MRHRFFLFVAFGGFVILSSVLGFFLLPNALSGSLEAETGAFSPDERIEPLTEQEMESEFQESSNTHPESESIPAPKNLLETILPFIFTGAILLIFVLKRKKGGSRTTFFQRLSHMSSEIKGNYDKIPVDALKNNLDMTEEERQSLEKGEKFITDLIGEKAKDTPVDSAEPEEAGHITAHENLRELYEKELKTSLADIENTRKSIARTFIFAFALLIIGFLSFPIVAAFLPSFITVVAVVLFLIAVIALLLRGIFRFLKYRNAYKAGVVSKVVGLINPKYLYNPNKHVSLDDFSRSRIIDASADKCTGDDYICGKIDKTLFEFSEFVAQNEYEDTDDDGKKVTRVNTLFNGLFFLADFNKHIGGETFVFPDKAERLLGKGGQNFQRSPKGELVKLENPEFEKFYAVFSNNRTEARYILTPTMMEGMVNIRKKIGQNIRFSFIGERVYCGVEFNKALFEASIFKPVRFADVELMHSLFSLIETLITEMNLNTRIWTKE